MDARGIHRDYQRHITAEGRPKSLDSGGFTPLLYAARENCIACVDALLKSGADIDLPDPDGVSPLHLAIMNANWDLAKKLIEAGADVNQWDIFGEAPLFTAVGNHTRVDGGRASIDPPNETKGIDVVRMLLDHGANPNMQLFFRPANVRGSTNTRGSTPLIRAANNVDQRSSTVARARRRRDAVHGRPPNPDPRGARGPRGRRRMRSSSSRCCTMRGTDVNSVALVNHIEEVRGGCALHYAVRKRYKDVIQLLASYGIDMNLKDQDGLTALDYTQSRGFMPFMANPDAAVRRGSGAAARARRDRADAARSRVAGARPAAGHVARHLAARRAGRSCADLQHRAWQPANGRQIAPCARAEASFAQWPLRRVSGCISSICPA